MKTNSAQAIVREASPDYLEQHPVSVVTPVFWEKEAVSETLPTGPMAIPETSINLSGIAESRREAASRHFSSESEICTEIATSGAPDSLTGSGSSAPPAQTPSTLAELSDALRDPLPKTPVERPRCYSALEAMAAYKPLTLEDVRQLIADKRAAQDVILREYTERTGQEVDYCDNCDLGVIEEEIEEGYGIRVESGPCEACDGLGVIAV